MKKAYPVVPQLLTVSQTAELLCVSRQTVYTYIYKHGLPSITVGGIRRIHPDSLMKWLAEHENLILSRKPK